MTWEKLITVDPPLTTVLQSLLFFFFFVFFFPRFDLQRHTHTQFSYIFCVCVPGLGPLDSHIRCAFCLDKTTNSECLCVHTSSLFFFFFLSTPSLKKKIKYISCCFYLACGFTFPIHTERSTPDAATADFAACLYIVCRCFVFHGEYCSQPPSRPFAFFSFLSRSR